jgi:peptidyl-prolyl cis-trans isomerase NIMA-interacting 1
MAYGRNRHPIRLGVMVVLASFGCGGAPSGGAAAPVAASPAERCLADADAKRAHLPSEPDRISVKHVIVKYSGAKGAPADITRTREQACLRAQEALEKLKGGTPFSDVVATYSDESGAASRDGSIGAIERTDVAAPFADAAFQLKTHEVSDVVESPFGFHVIYRVE